MAGTLVAVNEPPTSDASCRPVCRKSPTTNLMYRFRIYTDENLADWELRRSAGNARLHDEILGRRRATSALHYPGC